MCVRACVRVCVCVRACVRACVCVCVCVCDDDDALLLARVCKQRVKWGRWGGRGERETDRFLTNHFKSRKQWARNLNLLEDRDKWVTINRQPTLPIHTRLNRPPAATRICDHPAGPIWGGPCTQSLPGVRFLRVAHCGASQ